MFVRNRRHSPPGVATPTLFCLEENNGGQREKKKKKKFF
jgi:hypothetical protein